MKIGEFDITIVSDSYLGGYDGMNYEAAKFLGFPSKINKNQILINSTLDFTLKIHTVIHEVIECIFMRKGLSYWQSHEKALIAENDLEHLRELTTRILNNIDYYNYFSSGNADSQL